MVSEAAWTRGDLVLTRAVLDAVEADALAAYARDEEACGYLVGPAGDPRACDGHVAMQNLANKLHALDPETYFRTGRMFFAFHENKFDDAVRAGAASGRPVKVLYHSHLDAGAYFSPTDAAVMSMGEPPATEGGEAKMGPGPAWPLAFLVTSVVGGKIAEHRLFVWSDAQRAFVASSFEIA
ncbi:MAG TPA: Mov34/MPN/PAD-1 family protein [Minicystis sp.]|nr:Mov34/MPN/PAD-1 family protein [Minicystis sp.]